MLHRPISAPVWAPAQWLRQRGRALTASTSNLLRYVLVAAILTAIGCAYLWQVNRLSGIYDKTVALQDEAHQLEIQNVMLIEQLAQWNSPDYVQKRSTEEGYVAASPRAILGPTVATWPAAAANTIR